MRHLRQIEEIIRDFGNPYIDILHNTSVSPQKHVVSMLRQVHLLCACVTPHFFTSEWVRLELHLATYLKIPILFIDLTAFSQGGVLTMKTLRKEFTAMISSYQESNENANLILTF